MKRDPLSNEPFDSTGFSTSSPSLGSTPSSSGRRKTSRNSSETAWNWVLFLALVATVYYFWIFPLQSPRKPLKVIFENGPLRTGATETGQAGEKSQGIKPSDLETGGEISSTDNGVNEPATDSEPTR